MPIKIPLRWETISHAERDIVTFTLSSKNIPAIFTALVDTGCPFIIIMENALTRTRIPFGAPVDDPHLQNVTIGDVPLILGKIGICKFTFKDENNKPVIISHEVYSGRPNIKGKLTQNLPNLLGRDFLKKNKFAIKYEESASYLLKD